MDLATDNARLRQEMRRVIAEREIAVAALRDISVDPHGAAAKAEAALDRVMAVRQPGAAA